MAADTDEATTALIAAMLAEDNYGNAYENQYNQYPDDSDDEDYGQASKRKKPTKKGSKSYKTCYDALLATLCTH